MIVMKFGGTSVGGTAPIRNAISIIQEKLDQQPIVVVSAMSKVTDLLYRIASCAANREEAKVTELVEELRNRHIEVAEELMVDSVANMLPAISSVNELCDELERFAKAVSAIGELSPRSQAIIVSHGELLSSTIIGYAMKAQGIDTEWVDARKMIVTDDNNLLKGEPITATIQKTVANTIAPLLEAHKTVITQGFIASTANGCPSILGRGGSDYTASLIGMAMDASAIEIWTDVDGVLTADPRKVANARRLDKISFEEAAEMSHFGAKVLHPMTIEPAVRKNIPIYVLNSLKPSCQGTVILQDTQIADGVKSVSYKEHITVINIFSMKMINTSGFLGKVFKVFSDNGISVDLISTSEANISVTIDDTQETDQLVAHLSEFAEVVMDSGKAQISIVGKNLPATPHLTEKVLGALGGTSTYMISQGATDINLSIVVDRKDMDTTIAAIHHALFQ